MRNNELMISYKKIKIISKEDHAGLMDDDKNKRTPPADDRHRERHLRRRKKTEIGDLFYFLLYRV